MRRTGLGRVGAGKGPASGAGGGGRGWGPGGLTRRLFRAYFTADSGKSVCSWG